MLRTACICLVARLQAAINASLVHTFETIGHPRWEFTGVLISACEWQLTRRGAAESCCTNNITSDGDASCARNGIGAACHDRDRVRAVGHSEGFAFG